MSVTGLHSISAYESSVQSQALPGNKEAGRNGGSDKARTHEYATEFEAILVSSLLEKMEQTVQTLPGEDADAGHESFQSMGVQAVGKAVANQGGFGIARMIEKHLSPSVTAEIPPK